MVKKYRPKKTCPLCLCNKGTEKKQKRESYVKTCDYGVRTASFGIIGPVLVESLEEDKEEED
jgi:hypothetical protein